MTKNELPLIVMEDTVLFPGTINHILVETSASQRALLRMSSFEKREILISSSKKKKKNLTPKDIHTIGVRANIMQVLKLDNSKEKIVVEVLDRVTLNIRVEDDCFVASYEALEDQDQGNVINILDDIATMVEVFTKYAELRALNINGIKDFSYIKNYSYLVNVIANHLPHESQDRQKILYEIDSHKRVKLLTESLKKEIIILLVNQEIKEKVEKQIKKNQKDYFLHEQMKVIQKELGQDEKSDFTNFEEKIQNPHLTQEAKDKAEHELKRLKAMNSSSAESVISRNYLDVLLNMPWGKYTDTKIDILKVQEILDADHYGLEKVKERIIEHAAVLQRAKDLKSPILCLVGPPGVGKTSLVRSIATAIGREYIKFSLGGLRDEAEIRGHRKTYIGAMPGKIISLIKKSGVSNPVMLLDEIDKLSSDFKGDPASALLEVLDPEQNMKFNDNFLEVDYDISKVMFIATANSMNIPKPLRDRMEIIKVSGYVESEKMQIAKEYLMPKQYKVHSVEKEEVVINDAALLNTIRYYTMESGVRNFDRAIASMVRKSLTQILSNNVSQVEITDGNLKEFLGIRKYDFHSVESESMVGVANGLAYTEVGGDMLLIEAVTVPGKGEIKTTGRLGDVMKESAQAAYSLIRSKAEKFGINLDKFKDMDIHLHVPDGATPKDGPSAGIAIFTSLISLFSGEQVRSSIAMTGEITLRGKVLPIGGLKEKLLAASRGGVKKVLIPKANEKDLEEIPREILDSLEIVSVSTAEDVKYQVFG